MTRDQETISSVFVGANTELAPQVPEAVLHLKATVEAGKPWCEALLEAIGLWTLPQEVYQDRTYQYLIQGEALDWLLLAERLCSHLDGSVPAEDQEALLFDGSLPESITPEIFRELIGTTKHRAYLNYWYGVVVEEALQLSVEEEVRKRHRARCYPDSEELVEAAFIHLYDKNRDQLLAEFQATVQRPPPGTNGSEGIDLSLTDLKEFTYWLFKRRISIWDPARVASDTRKGIRRLNMLEQVQPVILAEDQVDNHR